MRATSSVLAIAASVATCFAAEPVYPLEAYWQDYFARTLDGSAVGYVYAIVRQGEPVAVGAHGSAAPGVPMTVDTRLQIASCTKPITAVALLHLLEQEGISPDVKMLPLISDTFPETGEGVDEITIRHLLTHTSGYGFDYIWAPRLENTRTLLRDPVPNPRGEKRVYSNINYSLARTLIECVSGVDYETYVREEILRPAGAEGMRLHVPKEDAPYCYLLGTETGRPLDLDFRDEAGAYGWYATVGEVARVLRAIRTGRYLSSETTRKMLDEKLGFGSMDTYAGPAHRHDGQWVIDGNLGVQTAVVLFPDDVEAVLLINTNGMFSPGRHLGRGFDGCVPRMRGFVAPDGKGVVRIERPTHADEVRWTDDGSEPDAGSLPYQGPITVDLPATVRSRGFRNGRPVTFVNTLTLEKK